MCYLIKGHSSMLYDASSKGCHRVNKDWRCAGETKEGYYQPLEKAELVRTGRDVTILCYSRMRYVVMQAVQQLEKMGYDPEVRASPAHGNLQCSL